MCRHFLGVAVYFPLNRNCILSNGALLSCSLTSCVELWSHAPVSCYRILQNKHQRYQLHTAFYSSSCNFQLFHYTSANCKSFTNRLTIQLQIPCTYSISKPQSVPFPPHLQIYFSICQNAIQLVCNPSLHRFTLLHSPNCNSAGLQSFTAQIHTSAFTKLQFSWSAIFHCTNPLYSHFSFPLTIIHGSLCSFSSSWSSWFLLFWLMSNDALSFYLVLIVDPHVDHLGVGFIRSFTPPPNASDAPMRVLDR